MNELYDTPKDKNLIYDAGLHKGEDTEFYLKKGFRVVAFEADPDLVLFCKNRFKEFIDQGQLTIVEGAIVDLSSLKAGQTTIPFYKNNENSVWGTIDANWAERDVRQGTSISMVEVNVIDFANIIRQYGVPHYIKADIEGLDMICMNALKQFKERPDFVSIESNKTSFSKIKEEIGTLVELGYNSFQAVEQSAIHNSQSPPYPAREGNYVAHTFESGSSGLFGSELPSNWISKPEILRQYRFILLGYYLLGDDGIARQWKFPGSKVVRSLLYRVLRFLTKETVPGWYDTHARHSSVEIVKS